jgi:hypothetical protein
VLILQLEANLDFFLNFRVEVVKPSVTHTHSLLLSASDSGHREGASAAGVGLMGRQRRDFKRHLLSPRLGSLLPVGLPWAEAVLWRLLRQLSRYILSEHFVCLAL